MDLDKYNDAASKDLHWFYERLSKEGVEQLWRSSTYLGLNGVLKIASKHEVKIYEFIDSSPSLRNASLKQFTNEIEKHGFLIAAAHAARCGAAWLDVACRYGMSAACNPAPRFLLRQAATAALELEASFPTLWPFEDHPDPFGPCEP
jgi:hypothetical protein